MNGSYRNCTQTQPIAKTSDSIQQATAAGQMVKHDDEGVATTDNIQQEPASTSVLTQNMVDEEEVNVSNF
jgi:hypothetical protein